MSTRRLVALVALVLLVAACVRATTSTSLTVSADFDRATGLYPGSEVRILGVRVGKVTTVEPAGDHVRVSMTLTEHTDVPADVKAAIVAPSLVSGRYVQLAPAYTGGPKLGNDAVIPRDRTAVPVEWDDIKNQITRITSAVAPTDGKKNGSLSRFVTAAAGAFEGNGARAQETIRAMAAASDTLSGNQDNLFLTLRSLADFITAMNQSGTQIESFARELSSIAGVLSENRTQLGELLQQSRTTVRSVRSLVTENRAALRESVGRVTAVSDQLAKKQVQLANILHLAPTTLANFYNIYDPTAGSLTGRLALGQTMGLANVTCQAMFSAGGTLEDCKRALGPLLDLFNRESLPISANPLNQPGTPNQDTPAPPPAPAKPVTPLVDGLLDLLLGGRS